MKMNLRLAHVSLGLVASLFSMSAFAADNSRVYVVFKERQKATAKALVQQAAGQIHYEFDELRAIAATLPAQALDGLSRNPSIQLIEADPPRFMLGQVIPYGIDMVQARSFWDTNPVDGLVDAGALSGAGIKVGVIDSGVY
jgi:serine protease